MGSEQYFDESPNEEARHFYDQLEESSCPLCERNLHSTLLVAVRLMNIKSDWNILNADIIWSLTYQRTSIRKTFDVQVRIDV